LENYVIVIFQLLCAGMYYYLLITHFFALLHSPMLSAPLFRQTQFLKNYHALYEAFMKQHFTQSFTSFEAKILSWLLGLGSSI